MNKRRVMSLAIKAEQVTVYHLRYTMKGATSRSHCGGTYRDLQDALSEVARSIVEERYPFRKAPHPYKKHNDHLPVCDCDIITPGHYGAISILCRLHEPHYGYFAQLRAKLMRWLEKGYVLPDSIEGLR